MNDNKDPRGNPHIMDRFHVTLVVTGAIIILLGLIGLLGFIDEIQPLARFGKSYIPIAPDTGAALFLFGLGFVLEGTGRFPGWMRKLGIPVILILCVYVILKVLEFILQTDLTFQDVLFPGLRNKPQYPKTGMSPVTATLLFLAGFTYLSSFAPFLAKRKIMIISILGFVVMVGGLIAGLGYLFGTPFLYSNFMIPISAPSTIGLVALGLGLIMLTGRDSYWARLFNGETAQGRMMRVILPLVVSAILIHGFLLSKVENTDLMDQTILSVLLTLFFSIITPIIIFNQSKHIYQKMARIEVEKKQAQELLTSEQNRLRTLIDNLPDRIFFKDRAGRFIVANDKVAVHSGVGSAPEIIGKTDYDLYPAELAQQYFKDEQDLMRAGEPLLDHEEPSTNATGEIGWTVTNKIPIRNEAGVVVGLVGVSRDITEFKKALKEIVTAKEAAEQASRLKDYFIANLSHEIRTPLNAIIGFTELLKEEVTDVLPETAERYFPIITSAGVRLVRTIDMILNLSKLQSGMYTVTNQPVDLDQVIRNLVGETSLEAKKRGLELTYEKSTALTTMITDEYCVIQSLSNLVDNALKYTNKGFVRVRLYQNKASSVCIEVKDSGIGIDAEYLNRLFEPFTQEDTSFTRAYEGIGLGLSITKRLLNAIGGTISVTSIKSAGSTFTIELPLQSKPE